ncbi:MAG TPA: site-specific integrase [Bacteroidales bacterium]|nr:site-specific integrase [Bacteroidales bacterium]HNW97526.1 site-specific integrase [Bacteroidales bacterium]
MNDYFLNNSITTMNTNSFEYYLKDSGLALRTIEENVKDIERFEQWAIQENYTDIAHLNYNELLKYVQYLKSKKLSIQTVNIRVCSIRKYYDHLKEEGIIEINPARHLHIKGQMQRITENPLTYTDLETLYNQYAEYSKDKRNRLRSLSMLGLIVWQGLHGGELGKIEVQHINLNNGTVYIPGTRRSNSRELKLEAKQIIVLNDYLNALPIDQTCLFVASRTSNIINWLLGELRGLNPVIRNVQHIRASVFLYWLKMYDKRQVQYMAGHRLINSIQHYEVQELDSLTDMLSKHHPFG